MERKNNKNKIIEIGKIGKIIPTSKRKRYGIFIPYCFICYNLNSKYSLKYSKKRIKRGKYIIQFNGNTYYICKYCYSHKRKLKQFLLQFA